MKATQEQELEEHRLKFRLANAILQLLEHPGWDNTCPGSSKYRAHAQAELDLSGRSIKFLQKLRDSVVESIEKHGEVKACPFCGMHDKIVCTSEIANCITIPGPVTCYDY